LKIGLIFFQGLQKNRISAYICHVKQKQIMTVSLDVYEDLAEVIAEMAPREVIALKASPTRQARLEFLLEQSREAELSESEKIELEKIMMLNRIIALAKIRAKRFLSHAA